LTLTAIDRASGVEYELCLAGRDDPSHGSLRVEPDVSRAADADARAARARGARVEEDPTRAADANGSASRGAPSTTVVWRDAGDVGWNPVYRWLVPVIEPALARDLTVGLERLKQAVEAAH
jgi:hypothetical protein